MRVAQGGEFNRQRYGLLRAVGPPNSFFIVVLKRIRYEYIVTDSIQNIWHSAGEPSAAR